MLLVARRSFSSASRAAVQRAFVMQCHPDFFLAQPRQRSVNTTNLAALHDFLDGGGYSKHMRERLAEMSLHFYFKSSETKELPPRVTLSLGGGPKDAVNNMWDILNSRGIELPKPSISESEVKGPETRASPSGGSASSAADDFVSRSAWGDEAAFEFRWQREAAAAAAAAEAAAASRRAAAASAQTMSDFLAELHTREMSEVMVARRAAKLRMEELIEELRRRLGVEGVVNRCGWSAGNLNMVLGVLATMPLHIPRLLGFTIVFALGTQGEAIDCDEGEIRLSPADPPLLWLRVLRHVTPDTVALREMVIKQRREMEAVALEAFHGINVAAGLSCPQARYDLWLRDICANVEAAAAKGVSLAAASSFPAAMDYQKLRVRIEEGGSSRPRMAEDGTLQATPASSAADIWAAVARDGPAAAAAADASAAAEAGANAAAAAAVAASGAASINRARGVTWSEMESCCQALKAAAAAGSGAGREFGRSRRKEGADGGENSRGGGAADDAMGEELLRALRGLDVVVVKRRWAVGDGSEVAIPYDWQLRKRQRQAR